jgi:hypothetical protein
MSSTRHTVALQFDDYDRLQKMGNGHAINGLRMLVRAMRQRFPDGVPDSHTRQLALKRWSFTLNEDDYQMLRRYGRGNASRGVINLIREYTSLS